MYRGMILFLALLLSACSCKNIGRIGKEPACYSYIIGDAAGKIIKEHNADLFITPGSCQKIITAALAYKVLGSEYRYDTKMYKLKNGDLVISFDGDPTLKSEDIRKLLQPFAKISFKSLILDVSAFKSSQYSPNIMLYDVGTKYSTPCSAMNIDRNIVNITVTRNDKNNIIVNNDASYKIKSDLILTKAPSDIKVKWDDNILDVEGSVNEVDKEKTFRKSPIDIYVYIDNKMNKILKDLGIKTRIKIIKDRSKLPELSNCIAHHYSEPLSSIIPPAFKMSDNLVFDALYLKIIHKQNYDEINDWSVGDKTIKKLIFEHYGIDMKNALFIDGSGMSRHNRIQPKQLFQLLQKNIEFKDFTSTFPYGGEKASLLANRMLPAEIYAKTGHLSCVNCLSGYDMRSSKPKIFVIMVTNFGSPNKEMDNIIDNFIEHDFR
jgi:D-alanyl-D-alanine carboxypeptidase/D-alanyl-D-alanine-endopeptidase (penicillin-binding protein 4)